MEEAYIKSNSNKILLSELKSALKSMLNIEEAGEHYVFDGMTGEPIKNKGTGLFYLKGDSNYIGYIKYEDGSLYINNVPNNICNTLSQKFNANIETIYYNG